MDELRAALLGSVGGMFVSSPTGGDIKIVPEVQQRMHPAELDLLLSVLPVSSKYQSLRQFVEACMNGAVSNAILCSIAIAVDDILTEYEDCVLSLQNEKDIHGKLRTYVVQFAQLEKIILDMNETAKRPSGGSVLNHLDTPCNLPKHYLSKLTQAGLKALFRHVAQWVSQGKLLVTGPRFGFFIDVREEGGPPKLITTVIPRCIRVETANAIYEAGLNRGALGDLIPRVEALEIYDLLCTTEGAVVDGALLSSVVDARVSEVNVKWSTKMWKHITESSSCDLYTFLEKMRCLYLCSQGDVWLKFIQATEHIILDSSPAPPSSLEIETFPRKIHTAFQHSHQGSDDDQPTFPSVTLRVERFEFATAGPIEQAATHILNRIRSFKLQCNLEVGGSRGSSTTAPVGGATCNYSLVVGSDLMKRYEELFTLHIRCKFVHHAVLGTLRLLMDLTKAPTNPDFNFMPLQSLLHDMLFFLRNFDFYLQVDVQDTLYSEAQSKCKDVRNVEDAKRLHDTLLRQLCERCYLADFSKELGTEVNNALTLCLALHVACSRAVASPMGFNEEVMFACKSLSAKFLNVLTQLHEKLSRTHKEETRSLLCRLDFNRWLGAQCRPTQPPPRK